MTGLTDKTLFAIVEALGAVNHTMALDTGKTGGMIVLAFECGVVRSSDELSTIDAAWCEVFGVTGWTVRFRVMSV